MLCRKLSTEQQKGANGAMVKKGWQDVNSPRKWWSQGPWKRYSTTGSTVWRMAVRQIPGAPAHTHRPFCFGVISTVPRSVTCRNNMLGRREVFQIETRKAHLGYFVWPHFGRIPTSYTVWCRMHSMWRMQGLGVGPTMSSSSSCREKVDRRDMLDSEWRERTEMAESDLRGVPMGGLSKRGNSGECQMVRIQIQSSLTLNLGHLFHKLKCTLPPKKKKKKTREWLLYHSIIIIPRRVGQGAGGWWSSSMLFISAGCFCWKRQES